MTFVLRKFQTERFDVVYFSEILNAVVLDGVTGNVAFNDEGDRIESLYEVINIQNDQMTTVGTYRTNTVRKFLRSINEFFVFRFSFQSTCFTSAMCRQIVRFDRFSFENKKRKTRFFFADRKNRIDVERKRNHLAQRKSSKTRWTSNSTKRFGWRKTQNFRFVFFFIAFYSKRS